MKLSLSNGIFSKLGIKENFAAVKELGFQNIEFNMKSVKKEHDTDVYREQQAFEASGLTCLTLHSAVMHVKDPIEVHQAVYYGKISLECAHALKAPLMVVHSNVSKNLSKSVRKECLEAVFGEIVPFAKKFGIKLALENLSYTSTGFGKNVEQIEEVLDVIDPKREMGFTLDFCHALETKEAANLLEKYHPRLCNIHMANKSHRPFLEETRELNWLITKLKEYNYAGPVTLELHHTTTKAEITQTKTLFDRLLK
ncbi:MAG: sugar phosphate isomerase/epimerase family protein [Candidatus Bathyarchaeia archaeon]|jgi:sugar phosphate isomerase/epimerase